MKRTVGNALANVVSETSYIVKEKYVERNLHTGAEWRIRPLVVWVHPRRSRPTLFYVLPEFMYTTHEARPISHLVARSSRGKLNDTINHIMPLPVVGRLRVGERETEVKKA